MQCNFQNRHLLKKKKSILTVDYAYFYRLVLRVQGGDNAGPYTHTPNTCTHKHCCQYFLRHRKHYHSPHSNLAARAFAKAAYTHRHTHLHSHANTHTTHTIDYDSTKIFALLNCHLVSPTCTHKQLSLVHDWSILHTHTYKYNSLNCPHNQWPVKRHICSSSAHKLPIAGSDHSPWLLGPPSPSSHSVRLLSILEDRAQIPC